VAVKVTNDNNGVPYRRLTGGRCPIPRLRECRCPARRRMLSLPTRARTNISVFSLHQPINQSIYRVAQKTGPAYLIANIQKKNGATGHPTSLQIFRKLHDRIAWKLVNFCKIIQLLCDAQIHLYSVNKRQ